MLFDYLVKKGVVNSNPATVVRGPRQTAREGKTPILSPAQVRSLIESISLNEISGLRDRAHDRRFHLYLGTGLGRHRV